MRVLRRLALLVALLAVAVAVMRRRRPVSMAEEPTWPPLDVVVRTPSPAGTVAAAAMYVDEVTLVVEPGGTVEAIETVEIARVERIDVDEVTALVEIGEVVAVGAPNWVAPVDGQCPPGYPVRANGSSGIFHVPGGRSYARTKPERCYATAEDAEADGFRRAKL